MVAMQEYDKLIEQSSTYKLEQVKSLLLTGHEGSNPELSPTENIKTQKSQILTSRSEKSDFQVTRFGEGSILEGQRKVPVTNLIINTIPITESKIPKDRTPFSKF